MARKNTEELMLLQEAIVQIKKIKMEIHVKNTKLRQELDLAEHRLLEEYFEKTNPSIIAHKAKVIK